MACDSLCPVATQTLDKGIIRRGHPKPQAPRYERSKQINQTINPYSILHHSPLQDSVQEPLPLVLTLGARLDTVPLVDS